MEEALVLKSTGKWYTLELSTGQIVQGRIRGKLRLERLSTTNPIAAGDKVFLLPDVDSEGIRLIDNIVSMTRHRCQGGAKASIIDHFQRSERNGRLSVPSKKKKREVHFVQFWVWKIAKCTGSNLNFQGASFWNDGH